jgi:hypothetical protein|tara:strand:- start:1486 stop:1809 length:324 start_codon:yes stop_codon:yes gene_type:complete
MVANTEKAFQYFKIYAYCLSAILAGYTVSDLDLSFLDRFNSLKYQTIIVVVLVAGFFNFTIKDWRKNLIEIVVLSIMSIGTLQLLRCKFKKKNKNEKIKLVDQNNLV